MGTTESVTKPESAAVASSPASALRWIARRWVELTASRYTAERAVDAADRARRHAFQLDDESKRAQLDQTHFAARATLETESKATKVEIEAEAAKTLEDVKAAYKREKDRIQGRYRDEKETSEKTVFQAQWEATTLSEAALKDNAANRESDLAEHDRLSESLEHVLALAVLAVRNTRGFGSKGKASAAIPTPTSEPSLETLDQSVADVGEKASELLLLRIPRFFGGPRIAWLFVLPALVLVPAGAFLLDRVTGSVLGLIASIVVGVLLWALLRRLVEPTLQSRLPALSEATERSRTLVEPVREGIEQKFKVEQARIVDHRDLEMSKAKRRHSSQLQKLEMLSDEAIRLIDKKARIATAANATRRETRHASLAEDSSARAQRIESDYASAKATLDETRSRTVAEHEARAKKEWAAVVENWRTGIEEIDRVSLSLESLDSQVFPDLSTVDIAGSPPLALPPALRFGTIDLAPSYVPNGFSNYPALAGLAPPAHRLLPAVVDFPGHGSLVIEAPEAAREHVIQLQQAFMLRYLTCLPPARLRLTILDPVGLGRSFGAFMHLADHQEALVNTRIWTEPEDIAERLTELAQHIEMILQRCLRNEFATIEDYNASAGELAEPYRLLVVADFPAAFSEQSTRRLAAIAQSGPRCGVYILLGIDAAKAAALHHAWQDLRKIGDRLLWYEDRFLWLDPDLERYPLVPDEPPPADRLTPLIHSIGKAAAAASRVELPFEVIAPPRENWWEGDTARGIDIPLGRSGANRLQNLQLGSGTAQHVLIAGRTGSGKSTLLHALVTNAALRYGPDQIELYLIDFKKGVEFKTYASRKLPHARVIAIESDREFGLSVLEKLDRELKRRGELFRDAGVQDLPAYRARNGREVMPRILLVVDEFQEFFVEDDKLAQEASLLLDRLVRQGRAFGIHVHLGSQTLGGAYSLARSTLGQMAVRIALQCTETDAHLILSDDNSAARELARPGEAIYNDANGLAEGNSHFQVVWLDDRKRDRYLREIADLAKSRGVSPPEPIVFEGHAPADLARCEPLLRARGRKRSARLASVSAWLGEAVAIKDPTAVVFSPQAAANFLLIGPNEAAALGCLNALLESLAAQCTFAPPSAIASGDTPAETSHEPKAPHARLVLAHASSEGEPVHRWIESLEGRLALPVEVIPPRELSSVLAEFVAEYERRQTLTGTAPPPWFLLLVDLQRFRELRKSDDDFSFSRRGEEKPANPSKQFATLIREGPAVGLHTVIWCDGMNTLGRFFDRSTQKEFAHRVLFQMSAGDSSNLIDSPAASRLGPFRGLYYQEERATIEKFRPYGLPESAAGAVAIADADKDVDLQASS